MRFVKIKMFSMCVGLIFIILMISTQCYAKIDSKSIAGIWLMDEGSGTNANDTTKNGNNGKILGNVKWVKGEFGNALDLPGGGANCVSIPHNASLNLVTWTATAWVKIQPGTWQGIVVKASPPGAANRNYGIWTWDVSGQLWAQSHFPAAVTSQGKTVITSGEWFHVAGSYDGKFVRAYVNGEMEVETAGSGNPVTNSDPLTIGAGTSAGDFPMKGIIDDVGLFNVAISVDDIKAVMKDGLGKALGLSPVEPNGKLTATWGGIKENTR